MLRKKHMEHYYTSSFEFSVHRQPALQKFLKKPNIW